MHALGSEGRLPLFFLVTKAGCPGPFKFPGQVALVLFGNQGRLPWSLLVPRAAAIPWFFLGFRAGWLLGPGLFQYPGQAAMPLFHLVPSALCTFQLSGQAALLLFSNQGRLHKMLFSNQGRLQLFLFLLHSLSLIMALLVFEYQKGIQFTSFS